MHVDPTIYSSLSCCGYTHTHTYIHTHPHTGDPTDSCPPAHVVHPTRLTGGPHGFDEILWCRYNCTWVYTVLSLGLHVVGLGWVWYST